MKYLFSLLLPLFLLSLAPGVKSADAPPLTVVTSIKPLALIAEALAPEGSRVTTLVPAWADPHSFQLKMSDMAALKEAQLVLWLGPDFERFLSRAINSASDAEVLTLTGLPGLQWPGEAEMAHGNSGHKSHADHEGEHDHGDAHIWLNPANAKVIAAAVKEVLQQRFPPAQIERAYQMFVEQISSQQLSARERLQPWQGRGFGVTHDGYGHFVQAFGLNQLAAVSRTSEERLSAKKLHQLQSELKEAACLIAEADTPQARKLARTLGLPVVVADPLGAAPQVKSYMALMDALTESFVRCLSGAGV